MSVISWKIPSICLKYFNPYFNGFRMSVQLQLKLYITLYNFNPYFNGFRMSVEKQFLEMIGEAISILILMDLECQ